MRMQFLRRRKLGYGSCIGMRNYLHSFGLTDTEVIRNDRGIADAPIVIRWGCTSNTPGNNTIINDTRGIHTVNNKASFRRLLRDQGVRVPVTFFSKEEAIEALRTGDGDHGMSLIGRPTYHSQGRRAVVCNTEGDVLRDNTSDYWSVIVPKDKEYRVYCFFGRVIAVAEKIPEDPTALLWNAAQNGSCFYNVRWSSWPIPVIREALKVHALSGLDFEGVDVMAYQGNPLILESNSAPSMTTEYRKQCFAKGFKWVHDRVEEGGRKPQHFSHEDGDTFHSYIHPAILGER